MTETLPLLEKTAIVDATTSPWPNMTTNNTEAQLMEQIVPIVVPILFGIIIILGLIGNALVVIVVAANAQMRSTTNILIINLAVADLFFIVFCVPFTAADYIFTFWPFGDLWCKTVQYLIVVTAYASVFTLVLMSLDRFLAVVHPIASMSVRTERNAITAIVVTWVVILVGNVYALACHGEVQYSYPFSNERYTVCIFKDEEGYNKPVFQIIDEELAGTVTAILFVIVTIFGFVGNLLAVTVVSCNANMRSITNNLIVSLSSADLLFIVFCIPFTGAQFVLRHWPFGDVWCRTVQYIISVTAFASVYTLVMLSFHRYLAVVHPTTFMFFRTERSWTYAIFIMWLLIILYNLRTFRDFGEVPMVSYDETARNASMPYFEIALNGSTGSASNSSMDVDVSSNIASLLPASETVCMCLHEGRDLAVYQIVFFTMSYMLPLTLIVCLYIMMLVRLWGSSAPGGRCSVESRRGKRRVTRMVLVVVAIFAICWCPIQVILVLKSVHLYPMSTSSVMLQIVSQVLAYINSCVNPILYAFLSENFRKAFRKVIYCGPRGGQHQTVNGRHNEAEKSALTKTTRGNDII